MIGGEFAISVSDVLNAGNRNVISPDVYTYSSGRAALYQILKYLKNEKNVDHIFLPDYLCKSILVPVLELGLTFKFYKINEELEMDASFYHTIYKKNTATLIINYFGLKDLRKQIEAIKNTDEHAIIIEDDVMAYYEFIKPLNGVDFKFTSIRKTFAIPDGGLVKTECNLPRVSIPNAFGRYKIAAALLKSIRDVISDDSVYLDLFKKGESLINQDQECGMSSIAMKLLSFADMEFSKSRRLDNSQYLISKLEECGVRPLLQIDDNHIPLFVPIVIDNRDELQKELFKNEIYCPIHWPGSDFGLSYGSMLAEKELSLIIDQRYSRKDMDLIVSVIKKHY